ncbi:MAG: hypothetical protein ABIE74_06890 [Pseudomonadota bacterium]
MNNKEIEIYFQEIGASFELTKKGMNSIIAAFHDEMKKGLSGGKSSLKMLPSFVNRPKGDEKGKFLALDLGGTNFRILEVKFDGRGGIKEEHVGKFVIPKAVMHGTSTQFFNFIAKAVQKFVLKNGIGFSEKRGLGFTFSFPLKQRSISSGILINWTKGFSASGVVGEDVVKLLSKSLKRYGLNNIEIVALINDTVGTLATRSYKDPNCDIGVIFGTGTNACYTERVDKIAKLSESERRKAGKGMIINIEWGNFNKLTMNSFDKKLDQATNNPKKQLMEKMIAGMYLGELTRLVLTDMIASKLLFAKENAIFSEGDFSTRHMSLIEADSSSGLSGIVSYLEGIGIINSTLFERKCLKRVCRLVSTRAAGICAAAISAVVMWMDPKISKSHTIAIDGTLFEKYPKFRERILSSFVELHGNKAKRIKLVQAHDGSGIGAATIAAVASSV